MKMVTKLEKPKKANKKDGAQYMTVRLSNENVGLKEKLEKIADRNDMTLNELVNAVLVKFHESNK